MGSQSGCSYGARSLCAHDPRVVGGDCGDLTQVRAGQRKGDIGELLAIKVRDEGKEYWPAETCNPHISVRCSSDAVERQSLTSRHWRPGNYRPGGAIEVLNQRGCTVVGIDFSHCKHVVT